MLHDMIGLAPPMRATHFHADYVFPSWYRSMHRVDTIGRHHFYVANK
jgi:spore germination cell wall hydrolase CwlJ-like protein